MTTFGTPDRQLIIQFLTETSDGTIWRSTNALVERWGETA
jgi:hypothetical protein